MNTAHTIARRAPIYARAAFRLTIAAGVLAGCILADCAVLAYDLGRLTGAAVHARNDQLAALAVRVLAPSEPAAPAPVATAEPEPEPTPAPVTVSIAPEPGTPSLAEIADCRRRMVRLERMTVVQLRDLTGARSKRLRKADLVQIALESAMA